MKRNRTTLFLLPALLLAMGCSDNIQPGDNQPEAIHLYAAGNGLTAVTKATEIEPFETTIFARSQSAAYPATPSAYEWTKDATVEKSGSVSFAESFKPNYPETGGWIYLVAVAPKVAGNAITSASGTVSYTLGDTPQDLLYAKEIQGSRWEGQRFSGNTDQSKDKPLAYEHLLTQLQFKAKKAAAGGLSVAVNKITVKNVNTAVTVKLADGTASFTGDGSIHLALTKDNTVTDAAEVPLGNLLLPPLQSGTYTIDVETSIGTFKDIELQFPNKSKAAETSAPLQPGVSHTITLTIYDTSLAISSVKVAAWTAVNRGQLDIQ